MKIKSETVTSDPVKYAATATTTNHDGTFSFSYVGDEDESRAQCKTAARKGLEAQLAETYYTRN